VSVRPTPPASNGAGAKSGEHPAVKAYRAKLASVSRGMTAATHALDLELEAFLEDMKTLFPEKSKP